MVKNISVIGKTELVSFPELALQNIPAKVDTGADSSAIWASAIKIDADGALSFVLFDKSSKFYTGQQLIADEYRRVKVANAHGASTRYKVKLLVNIGGRKIRGWFSLADRSGLEYPVLLGRRLLHNKFIVDVSQNMTVARKSVFSREILVLGVSPPRVQEFFSELTEASGASFTLASLSRLLFFIGEGGISIKDTTSDRDIASFGLVYFKTSRRYAELAAAAANYLASKNVKFIDQELAASVSYDKLTEATKLALANIDVPKTVGGSAKAMLENLDKVTEFTGWPIVVKEAHEDRGRQNYLLQKPSELKEILKDSKVGEHFIVQEFVQNDGFLRAYVFGGELALAVSRVSTITDDARRAHLNKPAGSNNASLIPLGQLSDTAKDLAIRAAMCLNRQVAGVDLIYDKKAEQWRVLEVNSAPQLRTGSFTAEKLAAFAEYIKREIEL